jgi:hypothetical protein
MLQARRASTAMHTCCFIGDCHSGLLVGREFRENNVYMRITRIFGPTVVPSALQVRILIACGFQEPRLTP